jgi:hypothetical protein
MITLQSSLVALTTMMMSDEGVIRVSLCSVLATWPDTITTASETFRTVGDSYLC